MTIIELIAEAGYIATPENVEFLARQHNIAADSVSNTGATYLSILIATTQKRQAAQRGRNKSSALEELELIHQAFYAAVLRGVSEPTTEPAEAHRRASFARSAKSTLAAYLAAGKDIKDLVPGETSKRFLRAAISPPEPVNRTERLLSRTSAAVKRAFTKVAKKDLPLALREMQALIEDLNHQLDELEHQEHEVIVKTHTLSRRPAANADLHAPDMHS